MIKVQNKIATREPLPSFLVGLLHESLRDLSWTDPQLGVQDCAWLPEDDKTPALGQNQVFDGTEEFKVNKKLGVVTVIRGVREMTPEEVQARWILENPAPQRCTRRQALLALLTYGIKRMDIENKIEAIADEMERESAYIEYLADTWEYDNECLNSLWVALGGTPEQLADVFRLAVTFTS